MSIGKPLTTTSHAILETHSIIQTTKKALPANRKRFP